MEIHNEVVHVSCLIKNKLSAKFLYIKMYRSANLTGTNLTGKQDHCIVRISKFSGLQTYLEQKKNIKTS